MTAQGPTAPPPGDWVDSPGTPREEFLRAHYVLIADHATQLSRARWNYVQLSLFGVAVFYSHLFSTDSLLGRAAAMKMLIGLPVALAIFGGIQAWAIRYGIHERNLVLMSIEKHYGFDGWAHNVDRRWNTVWKNPFDFLVFAYWALLFIFTAALALAVWCGHLAVPE
jgi:hypothetical protein